jgi:hypothetical protein
MKNCEVIAENLSKAGWELVATAAFNGDNKPDYVLYRASARQTAIWYLNNNVLISGAYGPTLRPAGAWSRRSGVLGLNIHIFLSSPCV